MRPALDAHWQDLVTVLGVFWGPPAAIFTYLILREVRKVRGEAAALKREMRTTSAEGFPPPGPPTTDSLSDDGDTLEDPPTAEPR